jgi:hypothetical protein
MFEDLNVWMFECLCQSIQASRRFYDSLVTALMQKELDTITKGSRVDQMIFTGQTNSTPIPQDMMKEISVSDVAGGL